MFSCSVYCESKKKGWNIFKSMLPLMSVISLAGMVISDVLANSGSFDSPVIDMMAPAMILIFSQPGTAVPRKRVMLFPLLVTVLAITVSVARIVVMMSSQYLCLPFREYLPALLAFIMLVFIGVKSAVKTGAPVINELYLAIFFALLIGAVYNDILVPGRSMLLFLLGSSTLFYLHLYACAVKHANRSKRTLKEAGGHVKIAAPVRSAEEKADNLEQLYARIQTLFDEQKPYLDENITVGDIAKMLYTNKAYLSRTINDHTGKNFCQFVNYYRVMYSMDLFRKNPWHRVAELADMSGFHTIVSYNMAFRFVNNESPGEWCRRTRLEMGVKNEKGR